MLSLRAQVLLFVIFIADYRGIAPVGIVPSKTSGEVGVLLCVSVDTQVSRDIDKHHQHDVFSLEAHQHVDWFVHLLLSF